MKSLGFLRLQFWVLFLFAFVFLFAAQAVMAQTAPTQVSSDTFASQLGMQTILAALISKLIQVLSNSKASWLSWISPAKPMISKILSAGSAAVVASGIAITHSGSFNSAEGLSLTIAGLSLSGLVNASAAWLYQWGSQHVFYNAIWKKAEPSTYPYAKS